MAPHVLSFAGHVWKPRSALFLDLFRSFVPTIADSRRRSWCLSVTCNVRVTIIISVLAASCIKPNGIYIYIYIYTQAK